MTREEELRLIDEAISAGKVTKLPAGYAWGCTRSWIEGLNSPEPGLLNTNINRGRKKMISQ